MEEYSAFEAIGNTIDALSDLFSEKEVRNAVFEKMKSGNILKAAAYILKIKPKECASVLAAWEGNNIQEYARMSKFELIKRIANLFSDDDFKTAFSFARDAAETVSSGDVTVNTTV